MTPAQRNIALAAAVALVGAVYLVASDGLPVVELTTDAGTTYVSVLPDDLPAVAMADLSPALLGTSKAGLQLDGGIVAIVDLDDGGIAVLDGFPCVRRRVNSLPTTCMRQIPGLDLAPRDFGELNRFPSKYAVGADCEPVACSVWAGESDE